MRLKLPNLQGDNNQARKLRAAELPEKWENIEEVLQYRGLPYIPRSFDRNWLVGITTILWQVILGLTRPKSWLPGNITSLRYVKMLKPTSKAAMFIWLPKLSGTSHTEIYRLCQFQLTGGKIYPWILWRNCQYRLIGKAKAMTRYSSSLIGSQRWYITNQWKSRSMHRVSQKSSLMLWYGIMAYLTLSSLIGALYSHRNSGPYCAIS